MERPADGTKDAKRLLSPSLVALLDRGFMGSKGLRAPDEIRRRLSGRPPKRGGPLDPARWPVKLKRLMATFRRNGIGSRE